MGLKLGSHWGQMSPVVGQARQIRPTGTAGVGVGGTGWGGAGCGFSSRERGEPDCGGFMSVGGGEEERMSDTCSGICGSRGRRRKKGSGQRLVGREKGSWFFSFSKSGEGWLFISPE